jgi:phosphatidylserine/phosphatidylglycerophosphate/cardiolipin synthase-like enzyme
MSALTSAVAQIQAQGGVKRLPKFGFNPEKAAGAGKSRSTFSPAKAPGPTPPPAAPVNVLAAVEDALGDLDALHELLEPRPVPRLNSWDLNKFKSEYPELMEKVKELKLALRSQIERAYLKALGGARREVLIANAYFFPGRRFRRALAEAARRGVRVRLLLQGRAEYVLPHLATQSLYEPLLGAGVEIVEYHRSFMHAKVAVIDDWATVGSSNIDPFSLLLAREANVVVVDAGFAATLRERLLACRWRRAVGRCCPRSMPAGRGRGGWLDGSRR